MIITYLQSADRFHILKKCCQRRHPTLLDLQARAWSTVPLRWLKDGVGVRKESLRNRVYLYHENFSSRHTMLFEATPVVLLKSGDSVSLQIITKLHLIRGKQLFSQEHGNKMILFHILVLKRYHPSNPCAGNSEKRMYYTWYKKSNREKIVEMCRQFFASTCVRRRCMDDEVTVCCDDITCLPKQQYSCGSGFRPIHWMALLLSG